MKRLNTWNVLRRGPYTVEDWAGRKCTYPNFWEYFNHLRGRNFQIVLPADRPRPELPELRAAMEANPADVRARMHLGIHLYTIGSLEEAYREYLEAIVLLSADPAPSGGAIPEGDQPL